jgi:tRNA threonylcarbamoyl adenosine modification protein YjeE
VHDFGRLGEEALREAARRLGERLEAGDVILFEGEMGAGKTTFTRALAEGMGVERPEAVCSPTYTIAMTHPGPVGLVHLDLFRFGEMSGDQAVQSASFEALGLAYDELPPPGSALVVEWSELWADPPASALLVRLARGDDETTRSLVAVAKGGRGVALLEAWVAAQG